MRQIRLNVPHEPELKIIEVSDELWEKIKPEFSTKQVLDIDGYAFNTAYFVDAIYKLSPEEQKKLLNNYNEKSLAQKNS